MSDNETGTQHEGIDFAAFYRDHWAELRAAFRFASRLGIDADDVTQETMMRARKHYHRFGSETDLLRWCKRVGTNLIRRQAQTAYFRRERPCPTALDDTADARFVDAEDRAVEKLDLARTLATLQPRHAKVLLLDAAGHSRDEIAEIFAISPPAAGMLLLRARRAARERWAKVVAAILLFAVRIRRPERTPTGATQALVAGVVSASVVAALVFPSSGNGQALSPLRRTGVHAVAETAHLPQQQPLAWTPPSDVRSTYVRRVTLALSSHGPSYMPSPLPGRTTCAVAPTCKRVPCPPAPGNGAYIYVKVRGQRCGAHINEGTTPVCRYVVPNPLVGCRDDSAPPPNAARTGDGA